MNDAAVRPRVGSRRRPLGAHLVVLALALGLAWVAVPDGGEENGAKGEPEAGGEALAVARTRQAADALTADLMSALSAEMAAGGPGEAIRVCAEVAQDVAATHSSGGMTVRRVSRKPRNPADRPDAYERTRLEAWAAMLEAGKALPADSIERLVTADGPVLRVMRPITIKPLCLQCHGDPETLAPEVRAILAEHYPEDEAVGYEAGDLRGAISVTVPIR